ncbi:MAG: DNA ligase (NAD(+)) LigA [Candidatus Makaraimicrobium thalassicum]|nr:MAG: DNA ligase (NAD(+)) LigA [Candidatus Omnitrophota bacterium]
MEKMTKDIKKKIEELRKKIRGHNKLYYADGRPEISDARYDRLMEELRELEQAHPRYMSPDSPTQTIGAPVPEKFKRVRHTSSMLSLESVNNEADVRRFDRTCRKETGRDVDYICEPKFDGISIELVYENGRFIRGSTRGNGVTGEDVTLNLKTISGVPRCLKAEKPPRRIAVRGEVIMHIKDFQRLNKEQAGRGLNTFANPRNVAAGSIRQLDYRITAQRKLHVYCYQILDLSGAMPRTQAEALETLERLGLQASPGVKHCRDITEAVFYHHDLESRRDALDYEIDGVVIKVNNMDYQKKLGRRTTNPKWAVAYKFEPRKEITRVENIVVQVGRTGILTPLALLQPVEVGGVTVSRATLHNMDQIAKLGVRIGDWVKVQRAGDVIPYVTEVVTEKRTGEEKEFRMPKRCPGCGTPVEQEDVFYRCPAGLACPAQLKEAISHYAGREAVDIDGFSDRTIECLHEKGLIKSISDIYTLKRGDLLKLERWREKKTDNLLRAIESSKDVPLDRFIFALGIRNVGKHIAALLADKFGTLEKIASAGQNDLLALNEIGPEIAENITAFFSKTKNLAEIKKLHKNGVVIRERKKARTGKLAEKKCIFTGSLKSMTRSEAKKLVESEGGEVASGISSTTDFVVVGEKPGSKVDRAKKKGIKVLTEEEFRNRLGL